MAGAFGVTALAQGLCLKPQQIAAPRISAEPLTLRSAGC
jgi:hypothetical protein